MTRSKIVEIAGRPYLVGLWWQIRSGGAASKKAMLKAAIETAASFEKEAYTHAALRADQYGLTAHSGEAWPVKTVSLAAALRPQGMADAFLGIFCLDSENQLWWVCGLLRGLVVADGDALFDSKEKAMVAASALRLMLENVGLMEVLKETPTESLEYLAPILGPEPPLASLFKKEYPLGLVIGGVAAVFLLFFALSWGYDQYLEIRAAQEKSRQLAEKEALRQDILANPYKYFKAEWLSAPSGTASGSQCAAALLALPISQNAWSFTEAACHPGAGLTVRWTHKKGASFVRLPIGARLVSAQEATAEYPLTALLSRAAHIENLLPQEQATAALYDLTQKLASQLTVNWEAPEQYRIDESTTISAPWRRGQFDLAQIPVAALLEADLFAALSLYPGSMLTSVTRTTNDLSVKGYIYATANK
jgi:hypothetical protein